MKRLRRGVSLTEMLVVLISCTALFSLSGELLCRVMRIQSVARDRADVERNALRLSQRYRKDVHQSPGATLESGALADDFFLRLTLADGSRLDYSHRSEVISRRQMRDGKTIAREEFAFPDPVDVTIRELDEPVRLALTVVDSRDPESTNEKQPVARTANTPISLELVAVLGRDARLSAAIGEEENE